MENYPGIHIDTAICDWCHPNRYEQLKKLAIDAKIYDEKGSWFDCYSAKKREEYASLESEYFKDKWATCMCVDPQEPTYICKKHLLEIIERLMNK